MQPKIFNALAKAGQQYWWNQGRQDLVTRLVHRYGPAISEAWKILDIGSAAGGTLSYLPQWGEVWGLDISQQALELCKAYGLDQQHLVLGSAEDMRTFADNRFDLVTAIEILEHLEHPEKALREIFRVLKPGGLLVLSVPADQKLWSDRDLRLGHHRRYTDRELGHEVRQAGLEVLKLSYANTFYYWPYRMILAWQRWFGRKDKVPTISKDTFETRSLLSHVYVGLLQLENRWILHGRWPWGVSVVGAARKPDSIQATTHKQTGMHRRDKA